jgi:hypothetical protein
MGAQHYDANISYPGAIRTWVPSHCLCYCRYDGLGVLKYVHALVSSVGLGVESKVATLIICTLNLVSFLLDATNCIICWKGKSFPMSLAKKCIYLIVLMGVEVFRVRPVCFPISLFLHSVSPILSATDY